MKKGDLKKLLKPIIKECVKEALSDKDLIQEIVLTSGVLSTVVREVASGITESQKQPLFQNQLMQMQNAQSSAVTESQKRRQSSRADAAKLPTYKSKVKRSKPSTGLEKIQENVEKDYSGNKDKYGALAGSNPQDEGVSLAAFGMGNASSTPQKQEPLGGIDLSELNIGSMFK